MTAHELIDLFASKGRSNEAYDALADFLKRASTKDVDAFVLEAIAVLPSGGTWFDMTLSHVSEAALDALVARAVEELESGAGDETSTSILTYASMQRPEALHPYLETLFELKPDEGTYDETWIWRAADASNVAFLADLIESADDEEERGRAWECLFETRRPDALEHAQRLADRVESHVSFDDKLEGIGYAAIEEPLYPLKCRHVVFSEGYFRAERPSWASRTLHPTWNFDGSGEELRFGGPGRGQCTVCSDQLHHLISLPEAHVFPGGDAHAVTALEVCLSCVGWQGTLFYHHGGEAPPRALNTETATPDSRVGSLLETRVRLAETPSRWRWQDWALANSRENLHRIGGHPTWVQYPEYPDCPTCGDRMHFVLQLDSGLPTEAGDEWDWGSGGVCYGFCCSPCRNTAFVWQCT